MPIRKLISSSQRKLGSHAAGAGLVESDPSLRRDDGGEDGFTLVELMVVIVIIGLLTTLVVINVLPSQDIAMQKKAQADIATIEQAMEMYRLERMSYPPTLAALAEGTGGRGGYIRRLPDDPWGRPYSYANPGTHGPIDIWSLGADGAEGGEGDDADISNWK